MEEKRLDSTLQPPAGLSADIINLERNTLGKVVNRPRAQIKLDWQLTGELLDEKTQRMGRADNSHCRNIFKCTSIDELTDPFSLFNIKRKKKPDMSPSVKSRLYGEPGKNIFNYELDKPPVRRTYSDHLTEGLIPKEQRKESCRNRRGNNEFLKGSLDESLIPREDCATNDLHQRPLGDKCILQSYRITDNLVENKNMTTGGSYKKNISNLGANLIPKVDMPISRRRQYHWDNVTTFKWPSEEDEEEEEKRD